MHSFTIAQVKKKKIDYDIPRAYTALSPGLAVDNVVSLVSFLRVVFHAKLVVSRNEKGRMVFADLQIADTMIWVAEPTKSFPLTRSVICLFVHNAQRTYKRALRYGARIAEGEELAIADISGNTWILRDYRIPGKSWRTKLNQAVLRIKNRLSYPFPRW